jgi:hypothetical protein
MECYDQTLSKDRRFWPPTEVRVKSGVKEEMMRKLICIIVAFMLMLIVIGCFATMSPEQRKEVYDMRKGVGNAAFVGDHYPRDEFGNITWVPPY